MININIEILNSLEKNIYETLDKNQPVSIIEAAKLCNVSPSKISKTIKKIGFSNYKEFLKLKKGTIIEKKSSESNELTRIKECIDKFDYRIINRFIDKIKNFSKIVLYGLGPSFICARYFEYKLRMVSNKTIFAEDDILQLKNMLDSSTILIIFSTTGKFSNFEDIASIARERESEVLLIQEEYGTNDSNYIKNIIYLTQEQQNSHLKPYEKTRTLTFIFIEEIISKLLKEKKILKSLKDIKES